jgi:hypothetical protein
VIKWSLNKVEIRTNNARVGIMVSIERISKLEKIEYHGGSYC